LRPDDVNVFSALRLIAGMQQGMSLTQELFAQRRHAEAEALLRNLVKAEPRVAVNHYNLACAQALLGKGDAALETLRAAVRHGFHDAQHIAGDADLASLRGRAEFAALVEEARAAPTVTPTVVKPAPRKIVNGVATVATDNAAVNMQYGALIAGFELDAQDPRATADVAKGQGRAGDLVRRWQREGTAAGLFGVLYDNHDRGHSALQPAEFPQLSFIKYSAEARRENVDLGLQTHLLFNLPTLGNSSTAQTAGALWRSQPRNAQTFPAALSVQMTQYFSNHLYVYPEHRDYDPGRNGAGDGWGDVFPAHTPYCVITQGSSRSDLPALRALALTLAAFQPATQERLIKSGLVGPTLQMLLRRNYSPVKTMDDYFTGRAHPVAFRSSQLGLEGMVEMAHAMSPTELPPVVRLVVKEEDSLRPGVDYIDATPGEALFDTPCAVARVWHSAARTRRLVLNADSSVDAHERPLTFRWALLQGRPEAVQITPLTPNHSVVELRVQWHDRFAVEPEGKISSNRVDIAAFASNGAHWSAPAFVSILCPDSQTRRYDAAGRLQSVEHRSLSQGGNYTDPLAHTPRDWRDEFRYDPTGHLLGWRRTRGAAVEEFTVDGHLVVEKDALGRPARARAVRYITEGHTAGAPALKQEATPAEYRYEYISAEDQRGRMVASESSPAAVSAAR
jgi:hypothetical protein